MCLFTTQQFQASAARVKKWEKDKNQLLLRAVTYHACYTHQTPSTSFKMHWKVPEQE